MMVNQLGDNREFQDLVRIIPKDWRIVNIEFIGDEKPYAIVDGPFGSNLKSEHYRETGIPVIQSGFVTSGKFIAESYVYVGQVLFQAQKRSSVESGDIVMAKIGAQCGTSAIVPDNHPVSILAGNCLKISTNQEKCLNHYLLRVLHFYYENGLLKKIITETAQPAISLKNIRILRLPLPPLPEQQQIAKILDIVDKAIAQTETLIAKYKRIKTGLMQDLLTRGIDENGQLRDPKTHKFKPSALGMIPDDWEVKTIAELAVYLGSGVTPTGGSSVYQTEGIIFIRSQNVTFTGLLLDDVAYIDIKTHNSMVRSEIFAYDILLNITGASIGRCCFVPKKIGKANVNQHVCAIRLSNANQHDAVFLTSVLSSNIGQLQIEQFNTIGNREGLNYTQLRSFIIPIPTALERQNIAKILDKQEQLIFSEQIQLTKLQKIKTGLMQDLLTGRISVKPLLTNEV